MKITWRLQLFAQLTAQELYDILRLRSEVFVVEQQCIFLDMDDKDVSCYHLMGYSDGQLAAYARLVPPGVSYELPSIGRIVTSRHARGIGMGRVLLAKSLEELKALYGPIAVRIGAQVYLKKFYESFGFVPSSKVYDEDGIDHIEMTKPA